jgi:hypothetical protein
MQIFAERARNRYGAKLGCVTKLAMATALANLKPTIRMELSDHLTNFHNYNGREIHEFASRPTVLPWLVTFNERTIDIRIRRLGRTNADYDATRTDEACEWGAGTSSPCSRIPSM